MLEIGQGQLAIAVGYLFTFLATFIVAKKLMQEEEARAAQENLEDQRDRGKASNPLVQLTRPLFTGYVVPMIRGKKFWDKKRQKYKNTLITAGLQNELSVDEFLSFKLFLIVFFPIVGGVLKSMDVLDSSLTLILATGIAGWFYPDFWIKSRIASRHKQMLRSLPFIVDLLALSTEAGLDFIGAMNRVVAKATPSPLVEEFEQLLKEIKIGSSRAEAMRQMAARINMPEINSFIAILISADQMGASIGKILRQQSDQVRTQRFVMAEKAGALATQKLLIPLIIFILPAVMLMVFGPFVLSFMQGGSGF